MGNVEIPKWLKGLPLAPEFRPTDTEFADPIAYISKIEKEASAFGICKVIPPLPKPSKRYVFSNLNKTLSKCPELGDNVDSFNVCSSSKTGVGDSSNEGDFRAVFTTRHQELGQSVKRVKGLIKENPQVGVHKQVWQSGEIYTLEQFESKSKAFAKSMLGILKEVNPLVIEALFWKAASEKPIYVEYANDVPGSAFGEPEGQFRYFHKKRRKRASYQSYRRSRESTDYNTNEMYCVKNSHNDVVKATSIEIDPNTSLEPTPRSSITSTSFLEETLKPSKRKSVNVSNDMEGTAGWKLSNSPWNLQVIARAPGSLTRFMPDDIPGVTSPMVYIGMLFSWFAWHVEDHELHSLNFLHTGSPKTWYAVPGDYAFAFEEVIRSDAYGGNIDCLAALTLLGEKTTLLSPEVVVSSGIPCCRLIQNPGEFVVTFPRAYHVGFSHGFNCGEAANFGTPQWLKVAKEAAVRRAAMNYLPMLSHQQLLYLLTMSFASRVPRSLLPGARNSRLRDRQREEREWSVKKAFIEDLLKENGMVSILLEKDSSCRAVVWNPDLLPCANKESQLPGFTTTVATPPRENASNIHSECNSESIENDLFKEMRLYMETLNDLYVDDDDLSSDFQVDSGALACVACGILGFPFMSVVQPSERASINHLPIGNVSVQGGTQGTRFEKDNLSLDSDGTFEGSVSGDLLPVPDLSLTLKDLPIPGGWNASSKLVRPRIFCLEHGLQIKDLLQSKGGANMLIICHSDYQKMKAHATVIAEEINIPFNYNEVQLESASQEDLNLIDIAVDDECKAECGEDWTSELGVNLRYCVKVRKNSPSKQVHHALVLGGLFSDKSPQSDFVNIKWKTRRSRTRNNLNQPACFNSCNNVETVKDERLSEGSDDVVIKKKPKLIQYTRRKFKVKIDHSTSGDPKKKHLEEKISGASCENHDKHTGNISSSHCNNGIAGSGSAEPACSPVMTSEILDGVQLLEKTGNVSSSSAPLQVNSSLPAATQVIESFVEHIGNQLLSKSNEKNGNLCDVAVFSSSDMQRDIMTNGGNSDVSGDSCAIKLSGQHVGAVDERWEMQVDDDTVTEHIDIANEICNVVSEQQRKVLADGNFTMSEISDVAKVAGTNAFHPPVGQMGDVVVEICCAEKKDREEMTLDNELLGERLSSIESNHYQCVTCDDTRINQSSAMIKEKYEHPRELCAAEYEVPKEVEITSYKEEPFLSGIKLTSQPTSAANEIPEVSSCATSKNDMQVTLETATEIKEEFLLCSVTQVELDQLTASSVKNVLEVRKTSSEENLSASLTSTSIEESIPNSTLEPEDLPVAVLAEKGSEVPKVNGISEDSSPVLNLDSEVQPELQSRDGVSMNDEENKKHWTRSAINEETVSSHALMTDRPPPDPIQKSSGTKEGSCTNENMSKGSEAPSSNEPESIQSTVVDESAANVKGRKRRNEVQRMTENSFTCNNFIRSPCEGLRPRGKDASRSGVDICKSADENPATKRTRKQPPKKKQNTKEPHKCDLEGCHMSFETKAELVLHKSNQCPHKGCGKRFSCHKYAIVHQRVHEDDRPLKCPWEGCSMSFKWAWARTEHIRVHTGEKPYQCKVEGCGLCFRFVSDFSRHRRKTGHYVNTAA